MDLVDAEGALAEEADVAVIGSGFTGLSCALHLAEAGKSVIVIEAEEPGFGASSRNGGMIGAGHRVEFQQAVEQYGEEIAKQLSREGAASMELVKDLIAKHGIDCDLQLTGRFRTAWTPKDYEAAGRFVDYMKTQSEVEAYLVPKSEQHKEIATDLYHGGVILPGHGGLNPRKFHLGLMRAAIKAGARVFAKAAVTKVEREGKAFTLSTARGTLTAGEVVVATNGYTPTLFRGLARRLLPIPSFIIATEEIGENRARSLLPGRRMMVETRARHCYYRLSPDGKRVVLGARAALTHISQEKATRTLRGLLTQIFPDLQGTPLTHSWRGHVCFTFSYLPHVGQYEGMHYALGYCGSGVAMAPYLGFKTAMRILGRPEGDTAFAKTKFPGRPYHFGTPWFMPLADIGFWWKDRRDSEAVGLG